MERVRVLIQKLQEQSEAHESPAALLATVRSLSAELELLLPRKAHPHRERVVVLLPSGFVSVPADEPRAAHPTPPPAPKPDAPVTGDHKTDLSSAAPAEKTPEPAPAPEPPKASGTASESSSIKPPVPPGPAFDPLEEVPTLAQQSPQPPVSPATPVTPAAAPAPVPGAPVGGGESLNDRLRRQEKELAHKLTDTPIRDLRKGIGLNERFLFLAELFRGDEAMYERSIKTINGFDILPEAEYWINRELKVKLGWDDSTETVQHFYGLVRRRFS